MKLLVMLKGAIFSNDSMTSVIRLFGLISSRPIQRRQPRTSAGRARRASYFYHVSVLTVIVVCRYMLTLSGQVSYIYTYIAYSGEGKGSHPLCGLWLRGLVILSGTSLICGFCGSGVCVWGGRKRKESAKVLRWLLYVVTCIGFFECLYTAVPPPIPKPNN